MSDMQKQLRAKVEAVLGAKIVEVAYPRQGMDSEVFLIVDDRGREWAVKVGNNARSDALAFSYIEKSGIDIPIPHLQGSFIWESATVLIMEKISFPLLDR